MAIPTTRQTFVENCLRRLGAPVLEINVSDEQIDDRVDEALSYWWDYHFDGAEKVYYKYQVAENNKHNAVYQVIINDGGTGYANGESLVFSGSTNPAVATVVTDNAGTITDITFSSYGEHSTPPDVTVTTGGGSGAVLTAELGGFVPIPENINGVVNLFTVGDALNTNNMFNIRYQIALNDLYTLTNVSVVPYYMAMQHIRLLEEILVGKQPIRYSRHRNRLYVDMDWRKIEVGKYFVVEAYEVVDPAVYADAWKDRWLLQYTTALIKRQWGTNLKKFQGMMMPGGVQFNGQVIYDEAINEILKLEAEMINSYSIPVSDMIG